MPEVRDRDFTGASGSFGIHTDIGTARGVCRRTSRRLRARPALEELYNFGPHVGNLAFEIGNPDLELERTIGLDLSLRGRSERASGELSFFTYGINDFVFLEFHRGGSRWPARGGVSAGRQPIRRRGGER